MSRRAQAFMSGVAACLLATAAVAQVRLREAPVQEPQWATLRLDRVYTGIYAEAFLQNTTLDGSGSYRQTRTFVGPLIGLGASGSIYHPNLITYRLDVDGSYGWDEETYENGGVTTSSKETRFLGWFAGELQVLDSKPLHGRLYANYNHTYQDFDFFNRIYVDTWRYGGLAYYTSGPWKLTGQIYRVTEDATDNVYPRTSDTKTASFDVSHTRDAGNTALLASLSDYTRNDSGFKSSGRDYLLSLSDLEDFGSRRQYHSQVSLSFNQIETSTAPTELYTAMGSLRIDHTDTLNSQHYLSYTHNTFADSVNNSLIGSSTLEHQLFDSLTSTLTAQGYAYSAESGPDSQESWQIGVGPGVNYTKSLSPDSSLTAYESFALFHTEVQNTGGPILVNSEPHSFSTPGSGGFFTLRQANVIESSIIVSSGPNASGIIYNPLADGYEVLPNGQLTMIQRLAGSTLPDSVFVQYEFVTSPAGEYGTINNACGLRFDFFNNLWSLYARYNLNQNSGDPGMVVQDLNDLVVGTEVNWRFLRAGAEYENYDSSLAPYEALRFFQNLTFQPEERSTLSFFFSETFASYELAGRSEQNYRAILRYHRRLASHLTLNLELGGNQRIGEGVDQTMVVCRPELNYSAGNFSAAVGYDFGYDEYLNTQENLKNRAFIRLRKVF